MLCKYRNSWWIIQVNLIQGRSESDFERFITLLRISIQSLTFVKKLIWNMSEKNNVLNEPAAPYGKNNHINDGIVFIPMSNMRETLRAQGCITHSELVERLSKFM